MLLNDLVSAQIDEKWNLRRERLYIERGYLKLESLSHSEYADPSPHVFPRVQEAAIEAAKFNLIYEGLIVSRPALLIYHKLKSHFPNAQVQRSYDETNGTSILLISFKDIIREDFKFLEQLINSLGWFFSAYCVNNRDWKRFDLSEVQKAVDTNSGMIRLQIEAKYDIEEQDIPNLLYHATPTVYIGKIQRQGLVPKSKNNMVAYGSRIYAAVDLDNLEYVLIPDLADNSNRKDWTIFSINTSDSIHPKIRWFKDPAYPYGYYTSTNIPPARLRIVKQISIPEELE